jgi:transcription elongation GreA/GreB family factor
VIQVAINKDELLALLRARVDENLESLYAAQATVQSGSIHEENRQEHPKDTRAIEAGYLARGLAERVEATLDTVAALAVLKLLGFGEDDPIDLGAVVALENAEGVESFYFLVPLGGGETLELGGESYFAVTPEAPIGRALIGQYVGDEIVLDLPQGALRMFVASVV